MQPYETPEIKRRPDGSIDTAHYMKIGRQERADQARTLANMAAPKRIVAVLVHQDTGDLNGPLRQRSDLRI